MPDAVVRRPEGALGEEDDRLRVAHQRPPSLGRGRATVRCRSSRTRGSIRSASLQHGSLVPELGLVDLATREALAQRDQRDTGSQGPGRTSAVPGPRSGLARVGPMARRRARPRRRRCTTRSTRVADSRIAAKTRSVRKLFCDSFIQIPRPSVAPTYSPKIAPIDGIDDADPEPREQVRQGRRPSELPEGLARRWRRATASGSIASGSTRPKPSSSATVTGKNVTSTTIRTFGSRPNPNQITNSGAIATIGMVWLVTRSGSTARRTGRPAIERDGRGDRERRPRSSRRRGPRRAVGMRCDAPAAGSPTAPRARATAPAA